MTATILLLAFHRFLRTLDIKISIKPWFPRSGDKPNHQIKSLIWYYLRKFWIKSISFPGRQGCDAERIIAEEPRQTQKFIVELFPYCIHY